jgi:hypothetical protein
MTNEAKAKLEAFEIEKNNCWLKYKAATTADEKETALLQMLFESGNIINLLKDLQ